MIIVNFRFAPIEQLIAGIDMRPRASEWSLYTELEVLCRGIAQVRLGILLGSYSIRMQESDSLG